MQRHQDESTAIGRATATTRGKWVPLALGSLLLAACTTGNTVPNSNGGPSGGDGDLESPDASQSADADSDTDGSTSQGDGDGSGDGDGDGDGSVTGDGDGDTGPRAGDKPVLYPGDQRHSPITASVAQTLQAILAKGTDTNRKNFIRVGDNLSHASKLLGCFDPSSGKTPKLDATAYAQPTVQYFLGGNVNGMSPFAYTVDMESFVPLTVNDDSGGTSWLQQQIGIAHPTFALVSFGPVGHAGAADPNQDDFWIVENVGASMLDIVDTLIAKGAIPLVRSAPPFYGRPGPNMLFTLVNALSRAVAQGRQVPFADAYLDYVRLSAEGWEGDGAHLADYMGNPCDLTAAALAYGDNVMNRIAVEQLHRAKTVAIDSAVPPDADGPTLEGKGTMDAPHIARNLPFVDLRSFAKTGSKSDYAACPTPYGPNGEGPNQDESAGERIYKYTATKTTKLRAFVLDRKGSSASSYVHHFVGGLDQCVSSHFALLQLEVAPGDHYFVVDASQDTGGNAPAEYGFGLVECDPAHPTCVTDVN